jgi:predicted nucleic acid-binding protein
MITYVVIDTGYLVELFKIPKHFTEENAKEIKHRLEIATKERYRLYIPTPVIFELANHIAHVDDGNIRRELVNKFSKIINSCLDDKVTLFNIVPFDNSAVVKELSNNLKDFVQKFADDFSRQGLGFTDSAVLLEAQSLKNKNNCVYIWTTDEPLKPYEPDTEPNPFIGSRKT